MAITAQEAKTKILTYEDYMQEEETNFRYDIVDGVRITMPNPTRLHQKAAMNILENFRSYERVTHSGEAFIAPCDVLITRVPLRTRQPDVLFISKTQLAKCADPADPSALEAAPELVVEILSPSETRKIREEKIRDYCAIGVKECWLVRMGDQTVEALRLTSDGAETVAVYSIGQTARSDCFPDLALPVSDIFVF